MTVLLISSSLRAQNSPFLWKHTSNSGQSEALTQDANQNTYVITDPSAGMPKLMKIKPNGQQSFNNSYMPSGYISMSLMNIFYRNGNIFLAGVASSSTLSNRLFLTRVDTSGTLLSQYVLDSLEVNTITGIKSAPFYNFGFYFDNNNRIYIGHVRYDPNFLGYYVLRKYDINFNLLSYYEEATSFVASAGPFFVTPAGTVYYSYTGQLKRLNAAWTGAQWAHSLVNDGEPRMLYADNSNHLYFLHHDYAAGEYYVMKMNDLGTSYAIVYDSITARNSNDEYRYLVVDTIGAAVYVAGTKTNSFPITHFVNCHDANTGVTVWRDTVYDGQTVTDLLLGQQRNLIAVGGGTNYYVWYYNNSGNADSSRVYDGPCGANDMIKAAHVDPSNRLIVTGAACENSNTIQWSTTLKYTIPNLINTGFADVIVEDPGYFYPVPAREKLFIAGEEQILAAFAVDINGKQIKLYSSRNNLDISALSQGLYLVCVQTPFSIHEGKVLVP